MACDRCSRLKDEDCAQCRKQNVKCMWTRTKKPTPAPDKDYVLYLEDRNKQIEQRLKQMFPGINVNREIDSLLEVSYDVAEGSSSSISNDATTSQTSISRARDNPTLSARHSLSFLSTPFNSRLLQAIRLTDITSVPPTAHDDYKSDSTWKGVPPNPSPQYYGPSSTTVLAQNVRSYLSPATSEGGHFRSECWLTPSAESHAYANDNTHILANLQADIPSGDLLFTLIDGYFERINLVFPILHRPLFESQLRNNLHTQDGDFVRLLLVVCAIGARWCKDPRVLDDQWSSELSAGYRWFRSAYKGGINVLYRPSLVNIQFMVLSVVFLLGTSFDDMTWFFAAKASRMFEALGSHRKKQSRTLADELMKRAFRCHFILDRFTRYPWICILCIERGQLAENHLNSTKVGKPSALQNIDVDMDDVMEIDDLQWTPELHAPPPPPQGSSLQLAALNHAYRLCITIGQALQTVFAPTSVKRQIGLGGSQGEKWIARSLNQQLDRWVASIPGNLRLPDQEDFTKCPIPHLYSTVTLWISYCYAAIYINRPFITSEVPEISSTSFHNCRQAARQCAKMIQAYYEVPTALPLQFAIAGVFSSAMILLVDLIANAPTGHPREDTTVDSQGYSAVANEQHLRICSAALERLEKYYHIARRLNDFIKDFQGFWTTRLAAQPTGTQPLKNLDSYDPCTASSFTLKNMESPALCAQPPPGVSTLAWNQSTGPYLTTQPPGLFEMGIPSLSLSQTQTVSNLTSISNELHSSPHDSGFLSEEWLLNIDNILVPGGIAYDLASSPAEPGNSPNDWNDTMERVLRLNEGGPML